MIKEKTVFVFGAGLSADYGFPLDSKLRDEIIETLSRDTTIPQRPHEWRILGEMGFSEDSIIKFREELRRGNFDTIDDFLEKRSNKSYHLLGKSAIAMALIKYEKPNIHYGLIQPRFSENKSFTSKNSFYRFLFKKMEKGATKENFGDNQVTIVTYNYDRSFEFFLSKTLENRYENINEDEVDKIMQKIKIIHVHGMIGNMRWQHTDYRDYDTELNTIYVVRARDSIVSFNEVGNDHMGYVDARKEIQKAKNVIFVGFGFHPLNLSRLIEGNVLDGKNRILGTAFGVSNKRKNEITGITKGNFMNMKAVQFANEHLDWL